MRVLCFEQTAERALTRFDCSAAVDGIRVAEAVAMSLRPVGT